MLNTHKLLYVLPDVAYIAELLPTKKEHTFAIQSFRQINGEFLDDNEFLAQNILKLFGKLEADEYHLILPDFLFTNTIVSVAEKSDAKIKEYLNTKLLPSLEITKETHEIETFVLTEFKGNSKVQISAIEKTVLAPIRVAAANQNLKIAAVSPLSWTIKSLISLEPSISVIQIGSKLYSSLHILGIDQTTMTDVGETDAIAETIKTLKGGEPNIQTVYLLSNELVENKLKQTLANTVPLQQLASFKDDDGQMPSYVREIIESGMKTLSISEFPVPRFELGKPSDADADLVADSASTKTPQEADEDSDIEEVSSTSSIQDAIQPSEPKALESGQLPEALPAPTPPPVLSATTTTDASSTKTSTQPEPEGMPMPTDTSPKTEEKMEKPIEPTTEPVIAAPSQDADLSATLSNFAPQPVTPIEPTKSVVPESPIIASDSPKVLQEPQTAAPEPAKPTVLKNNSGVSTMLKMVFITLAVFFATVAVGVGVGLGLLQFSNKETTTATPVPSPVVTPEPTIEPSPSASPSAAIDPSKVKVSVVNATTKAGYAGTIKTALEKEKFTGITTGNAKGEYKTGNYLLLAEDMAGLEEIIEKATKLSFTVMSEADDKTVEDAKDVYDVIVVLAE